MAAADRVGAAKRRRDRQLRAFRRHELLTVRMELAAALHHSAQRVEAPREVEDHETNVGLRAQMPPPPGTRPALREPGLQLVVEHAACPCSSGVPPLPALGGDCSLDSAAMSYLVRLAVEAQAELDRSTRREEEEKAKKAKEAKESSKQFLDQLRAKAWRELEQRLDSGGSSSKRKRKKRRKRRTPRTSSRSSCGRSRRRQRQWHTSYAGFPGDTPLRAVFPSVVFLGIMAVMDQKDRYAFGSGMYRLVLMVIQCTSRCVLPKSSGP